VAFGSKTVDVGTELTSDLVPGTTPAAGYEFVNWTVDEEGVATVVNPVGQTASAVTYTAHFQKASYDVTWPTGYTGPFNTAKLGDTNLTFTPALDGKIVTGVTYSVDATGGVTDKALTPDANGQYTLDGNDIIGNVTVKFTTEDGVFEHVYYDEYAALKDGSKTKIVILHTDKRTDGNKYTLNGYGDMFYSSVYGGYVSIVGETETDATLSAKLLTVSGTATEINYNGDVNGDGVVNAVDAGDVYDLLGHVEGYEVSDLMRLSCDVVGSDSADATEKAVTENDVTWILEEAVGLHTTSNSGSATAPSTGE
jgi:uncharacterized repeat protein (TIGR02543 family)